MISAFKPEPVVLSHLYVHEVGSPFMIMLIPPLIMLPKNYLTSTRSPNCVIGAAEINDSCRVCHTMPSMLSFSPLSGSVFISP